MALVLFTDPPLVSWARWGCTTYLFRDLTPHSSQLFFLLCHRAWALWKEEQEWGKRRSLSSLCLSLLLSLCVFSSSNKQCSSSEEPRMSVYQRGEGDEEKKRFNCLLGLFFLISQYFDGVLFGNVLARARAPVSVRACSKAFPTQLYSQPHPETSLTCVLRWRKNSLCELQSKLYDFKIIKMTDATPVCA